jgi:hypothetical protein
MKQTLTLFFASLAILFSTGCANLADGAYSGDKVLYSADKAITEGKSLFDTFLRFEKNNRETLAQWPEVKASADEIRLNGKRWVKTAIALREAYAIEPTDETRAALEKSISVIRAALDNAALYIQRKN